MSMYGANPDQLEQLGRTLLSQIEEIDAVIGTVSATLGGTTWVGPARDRFERDWTGSFRTALSRLNEAFGAAGRDCQLRGQELRRIMGAA